MTHECVIDGRYNGPAASANGGYACGVLAAAAGAAADGRAAVTLHSPPPLDVPLTVDAGARRAQVLHGADLVATVGPAAASIPAVPAVPVRVAEECQAGYAGRGFHPFPTCFVCGLDRPRGDGLGLAPGPVPGRPGTVACTWTPDGSVLGPDGAVDPAVVWAVLDCPGGWTEDMTGQVRVLGRMTARLDAQLVPGARYVAVGAAEPVRGRTVTSLTALYTEDGVLVGAASAVWVGVPAGDRAPAGTTAA